MYQKHHDYYVSKEEHSSSFYIYQTQYLTFLDLRKGEIENEENDMNIADIRNDLKEGATNTPIPPHPPTLPHPDRSPTKM